MRQLFVVVLIFLATPLYAGQGSAVLPFYRSYLVDSNNASSCMFYMSNVTDETIDVKVTLYNKTGSVIVDETSSSITSGRFRGGNVTNWNDNPSDGSITFSLQAENTGFIYIGTESSEYGFGKIEWTSSGSSVYGMVAHGFYTEYKNETIVIKSRFSIPVQNGLPF